MTWLQTIILAIVEGITEFLPVSSTGHMIIASSIMKISHEPLAKIITVNIQFGAILSVVVLYWKRFFTGIDVYFKLFAAFIPAAVIGLLAGDFIDSLLENVWCVAIALFVGGVILIFVDKWFAFAPNNNLEALDSIEEDADVFKLTTDTTAITYKQAFLIGCFQCIAMIPGVSRSASTIIGGMTQKLDRKTAAEFSFLLAVPTMFAASAYKLLKDHDFITRDTISLLAIGNAVAFVVAMFAIKFFITFLTKYGFKVFGYYRIILGALLLLLLLLHVDLAII